MAVQIYKIQFYRKNIENISQGIIVLNWTKISSLRHPALSFDETAKYFLFWYTVSTYKKYES